MKAAWPAVERLGLAPGASQSRLTFTPDPPTVVAGADLIQENGPERIRAAPDLASIRQVAFLVNRERR